jgi:3-isopropylmalate dehydrogenase
VSEASREYQIVVIPGDGICPEIVDATIHVLGALQERLEHLDLQYRYVEGGAGLYQREGVNLHPESLELIRTADATLKGPVGLPAVRLPDGTEAGLLGGVLRIGLDTYANVRPIKLLPGVDAPLKAQPGEIDYVIVRENTEGMYLARGKGIGTDEAVADTMLITRKGTERACHYAFQLARRRNGAPSDGKRRVTCVAKSNVLTSHAFFRNVFYEVAEHYPDIEREDIYADAAAQALVQRPQTFDVLVMENFLGDILSDLGGGTIGGIGLCGAGNIGDDNAYFEPIHGSAPDIAGQDRANPISQILCAAQMLEYIGETRGAELVQRAVFESLAEGRLNIERTMQPTGGTRAAGDAIAETLRNLAL